MNPSEREAEGHENYFSSFCDFQPFYSLHHFLLLFFFQNNGKTIRKH